MIYEELREEFNKLSDTDKNSLYVYKSRLGLAINDLEDNPNNVLKIYNEYKDLVSNPKNMFMAFTVFKDIDFSDLTSFENSLKNISDKVSNITFSTSCDTTLYRMVSIDKNSSIESISKSNLVSTSLLIDECSRFIIPGDKHYLFQINIEKGSPVSICPYGIKRNTLDDQLILKDDDSQKEVILNNDNYNFNTISTTTTVMNNGDEFNIVVVDGKVKNKNIETGKFK